MGPITRSVDDLELALRLLAGPDGRWWEVPPVPLDAPPPREVRDLRIAWTDDFAGVPVTAETRKGLADLAQQLGQAGATVERKMPEGFDIERAWETAWELISAETGSALSVEQEAARAELIAFDPELESPMFRGFSRGINASMRQVTAARMRRDSLISAMEEFLEGWDALLCPVTTTTGATTPPGGQPH